MPASFEASRTPSHFSIGTGAYKDHIINSQFLQGVYQEEQYRSLICLFRILKKMEEITIYYYLKNLVLSTAVGWLVFSYLPNVDYYAGPERHTCSQQSSVNFHRLYYPLIDACSRQNPSKCDKINFTRKQIALVLIYLLVSPRKLIALKRRLGHFRLGQVKCIGV